MIKKYVYSFNEGEKSMKSLLGGKGANLAEMTRIGLPVPSGITITTEACNAYFKNNNDFPVGLQEQIKEKLEWLEEKTGKELGSKTNPLLVSVRSGAAISMPGMMDTILNLGLNDETVEGLAVNTNDRRFALDCYRRFISMFGDVVLGLQHSNFERILEKVKNENNVEFDYQMSQDVLEVLIQKYKDFIKKDTRNNFPQDPSEQLIMSIRAVFDSWNNSRAKIYRKLNKIPDNIGTAVNIQSMVFGNMGNDCCTGVAFTRNPSDGTRGIYGEYLINAQGEDVVAGIRTPQAIEKMEKDMPEVFNQLNDICATLEAHYQDMQDIEFTVEKNNLYFLQTRNGKRTAAAAIKVAVDMAYEEIINKEDAIARVDVDTIDQLLHPRLDPNAKYNIVAKGLPASPGAASGEVVFDPNEAERMTDEGHKVILVRMETTPDDIHGIVAAQGVLTSRGGMTSHAAVVARGMGKPCVSGCDGIKIDYTSKQFACGETFIKKGDVVTINGATGDVIPGSVDLIPPELSSEFKTLLEWADDFRTLGVRANADTPVDAKKAREFGAKGIGLCRTEHMFMGNDRLPIVQKMILANDFEERKKYLDKLLPMQKEDFYGILKAMSGYPVTVRLLDPPLHEFLPNIEELIIEITTMHCKNASQDDINEKELLLKQVKALSELNPMLGHRGCRLGITFPEIYKMQAKAIFQAVTELIKEGYQVKPEVEIPLVMHERELAILREKVEEVAGEIKKETNIEFEYTVGTMIEVPRACATAGEIASNADFFSFGTNDLTQTTLGFSRDDAEGKFLQHYLEQKIINKNPFITIDRAGVGRLMELAVNKSRSVKEDLLIGICGEHGGDPESIEFCNNIGLDFVSCSPYRVPIARLAAAQSALK